jgi:hypothetical protein
MRFFTDTRICHYKPADVTSYKDFKQNHINLAVEKYKNAAKHLRNDWRFQFDKSNLLYIHGMSNCSKDKNEEISYAQFCMHASYFLQTNQLDEFEALCSENKYARRLALPKERKSYVEFSTELKEPDNENFEVFFQEAVEFIDKPNYNEARIDYCGKWLYFPMTCSFFLRIFNDELLVTDRPIIEKPVQTTIRTGSFKISPEFKIILNNKSYVIGQEMPFFLGHLKRIKSAEGYGGLNFAHRLQSISEITSRTDDFELQRKAISMMHSFYARERMEKGLEEYSNKHKEASLIIKKNVLEYKFFVEKNNILNHCSEIADYISGAETFYFDI